MNVQKLRYGENPHQLGHWYKTKGRKIGWDQANVLQGKELSYNNLLDLDAARNTSLEFSQPCAVAVKHNNPCGVAVGSNVTEAVDRCLKADPVSVFGGIIAVNGPIDAAAAEKLGDIFLECIVAPSFSPQAREIFAKKKNLRLLEWKEMTEPERSVIFGYKPFKAAFSSNPLTPWKVGQKTGRFWAKNRLRKYVRISRWPGKFAPI